MYICMHKFGNDISLCKHTYQSLTNRSTRSPYIFSNFVLALSYKSVATPVLPVYTLVIHGIATCSYIAS